MTEPDCRDRNAPSLRVASVTVCGLDDVFVSLSDSVAVDPPLPMPVSWVGPAMIAFATLAGLPLPSRQLRRGLHCGE